MRFALPKRFSLRVLFVGVTLTGVAFGWQTFRAERQRRAVARIYAAGGTVIYDVDRTAALNGARRQWEPNWLRDLCGRDWFDTPVAASLTGDSNRTPQLVEEFCEGVHAARSIEAVYLNEGYTDEKLVVSKAAGQALQNTTSLKILRLNMPTIEPSFWLALSGNASIEKLHCTTEVFSDEDVRAISQLTNLRELQVTRSGSGASQVLPNTWAELQSLTKLEKLYLTRFSVSRRALDSLADLPKIRLLHLVLCDEFPESYSWDGFRNLEELSVVGSDVPSESLRAMSELKSLRKLSIKGNVASDEILNLLRQALPDCRIEHD